MPKQKTQRKASLINKPRTNTLHSGMYYFLTDHETANEAYLKQIGLSVKHSKNRHLSNRHAVFLNYDSELNATLPGLFDTAKECHLSIDRDYYETDGKIEKDPRKWHYCHYTEVYTDGNVVHIYFNSSGQQLESYITEPNGHTKPLLPQQAAKIDVNITHASETIKNLLIYKENIAHKLRNETTKLYQECFKALQSLKPSSKNSHEELDMVKDSYDNYLQAKQAAEDISDIGLQLSDDDLMTAIAKAEQETLASQSEIIKATSKSQNIEKAAKVPPLLSAPYDDTRLKELIAMKDESLLEHQKEIAIIKQDLFIKALQTNSDPAKLTKYLKQVESLENRSHKSILDNLKPNKITLDFLKSNFSYVKDYITDDFCNQMIEKLITSPPDEQSKIIDICDFLYQNSTKYKEFLKAANNTTEPNANTKGVVWLEKCFTMNNIAAFTLLLNHGLNLGAITYTEQAPAGITVFKSLVYNFSIAYYKALSRKTSDLTTQYNSQTKRDNNADAMVIEDKFKKFLSVMLEPNNLAGAKYHTTLKGLLKRTELKKLYKESIKMQKLREQNVLVQNSKEDIEETGLLGILDFACKIGLPQDIIKMIIDKTSESDISLKLIAKNFGMEICDHLYFIQMKNILSNNDTVVCLTAEKAQELAKNPPSYDTPLTGSIHPAIYIAASCSDSEKEKQTEAIHTTFRNLLLKKLESRSESYESKILAAESLLGMIKSHDPLDKVSAKIGSILGAFMILANSIPKQTSKAPHHYALMLEAFLSGIDLILIHPEPSQQRAADQYILHIYRLIMEFSHIPEISLKLDAVLRTHGYDKQQIEKRALETGLISKLSYSTTSPKLSM